jgi:hypothetical protein
MQPARKLTCPLNYVDVLWGLRHELRQNLHNATMSYYIIRPMAVSPEDQYYQVIAVMTKDNFLPNNWHYTLCSIIVQDLIDVIQVCEGN